MHIVRALKLFNLILNHLRSLPTYLFCVKINIGCAGRKSILWEGLALWAGLLDFSLGTTYQKRENIYQMTIKSTKYTKWT
jgi:hypothetical protein